MDWVSCVRFSPNAQNPVIVSCGWDKLVKVLSLFVYVTSMRVVLVLIVCVCVCVCPS